MEDPHATPRESTITSQNDTVPTTAASTVAAEAAVAGGNKDSETPKHVSLKVVSQDGTEVYFKIKRKTVLRKLIDSYCSRAAVSPSSMRFLYDGRRIDGDKTPEDMDMEDDDIIDAVLQQMGGAAVFRRFS